MTFSAEEVRNTVQLLVNRIGAEPKTSVTSKEVCILAAMLATDGVTMNKRNKASEPFFSLGEKMIALGDALQDSRSRMDELASLAHDAGLRLQFRILSTDDPETEC